MFSFKELLKAHIAPYLKKIKSEISAISNVTGQFVGTSVNYEGLPIVDKDGVPINIGDWAVLLSGGRDYDKGMYMYNGTEYVFINAILNELDIDYRVLNPYLITSNDSSIYTPDLSLGKLFVYNIVEDTTIANMLGFNSFSNGRLIIRQGNTNFPVTWEDMYIFDNGVPILDGTNKYHIFDYMVIPANGFQAKMVYIGAFNG